MHASMACIDLKKKNIYIYIYIHAYVVRLISLNACKSQSKMQTSADKVEKKTFFKSADGLTHHAKKGSQDSQKRTNQKVNQSKLPSETTGVFGIPDRPVGDQGYRQLGAYV